MTDKTRVYCVSHVDPGCGAETRALVAVDAHRTAAVCLRHVRALPEPQRILQWTTTHASTETLDRAIEELCGRVGIDWAWTRCRAVPADEETELVERARALVADAARERRVLESLGSLCV
jgi:hypothetical protein